jgi:hypothetical protein
MLLGLPGPDPLVRGYDPDLDLDPDPSIINQKSQEKPYSYCIVFICRLEGH